jgi:hypothetical protein
MTLATPLSFVDLDDDRVSGPLEGTIQIGVTRRRVDGRQRALAESFACTLTEADTTSRCAVTVPDIAVAIRQLSAAVDTNPHAAQTLCGLLRVTERLSVVEGLTAESLAYSMLLGSSEFARWRSTHPIREIPDPTRPPVLLAREGNTLTTTLNRPERRNAFGAGLRDGLIEAFDLARLDASIERVVLCGNGPAFCSGGDLDEFGSSSDVAAAHLIRLDRSVALRIEAVRSKVEVLLHGACIGAGIELPSFAARIIADPDTLISLPELAMGLVPGAGGTVGITRRIGRWRTAYLAMTGARLDAATALQWGLVDALA